MKAERQNRRPSICESQYSHREGFSHDCASIGHSPAKPEISSFSSGLHQAVLEFGQYPINALDDLEACFAPEDFARLRAFQYIGVHTCFVRPRRACGSIHQRSTYLK
jgi:hypothetical protein